MDDTENNRLIAFRQGSEHVFRYYYEHYYHALCLVVLKIVKEETHMHDIVQDAFVTLWKSREGIESELHLRMFLYQVLRHRCFNHLKSKLVEDKYVNERMIVEEEGDFTNVVVEEEVHRLVIQEIEALPEEQKKVVYLHLEGKNNIEIAEILKISVNTVKTHKARARKTLKNKFDNLFIFIVLLGL